MSAIAVERLPVMDLAAMIRAVEHAMRDGTWKRSPIRGVKGEFYPCKPDIFEMTYEPAAPEEAGK